MHIILLIMLESNIYILLLQKCQHGFTRKHMVMVVVRAFIVALSLIFITHTHAINHLEALPPQGATSLHYSFSRFVITFCYCKQL